MSQFCAHHETGFLAAAEHGTNGSARQGTSDDRYHRLYWDHGRVDHVHRGVLDETKAQSQQQTEYRPRLRPLDESSGSRPTS